MLSRARAVALLRRNLPRLVFQPRFVPRSLTVNLTLFSTWTWTFCSSFRWGQKHRIAGPAFNTMEMTEEYKRPGESLRKYESFMAPGVAKIKHKKSDSFWLRRLRQSLSRLSTYMSTQNIPFAVYRFAISHALRQFDKYSY